MLNRIIVVCALAMMPFQAHAGAGELFEQALNLGKKFLDSLPEAGAKGVKRIQAVRECGNCKKEVVDQIKSRLETDKEPMAPKDWFTNADNVTATDWTDVPASLIRQTLQTSSNNQRNHPLQALAQDFVDRPQALTNQSPGDQKQIYAAIAYNNPEVADLLFGYCYGVSGAQDFHLFEGIRIIANLDLPQMTKDLATQLNVVTVTTESHMKEFLDFSSDFLQEMTDLGFGKHSNMIIEGQKTITQRLKNQPEDFVDSLSSDFLVIFAQHPDKETAWAAMAVIVKKADLDPSVLETNEALVNLLDGSEELAEMFIQRAGLEGEDKLARQAAEEADKARE